MIYSETPMQKWDEYLDRMLGGEVTSPNVVEQTPLEEWINTRIEVHMREGGYRLRLKHVDY